jgi:hypothetical protein
MLPSSSSKQQQEGDAANSTTVGPNGEIKAHKDGGGNFAGFVHSILDYFRGESDDLGELLLPDYENSVFFQEGAEPPLTLVVDLEETLGTSTWDRRHGWRFAKRPGLDFFLHHMARCGYEVVVFSTNPSVGAVEETLALLDPDGQFIPYKLYVNAASFRDGRYVKDFAKLNRDMRRVIVVDDTLADVVPQFRDNVIQVRPFDDISVTDDDTLLKLGVYLQTLAAGYSQGQVKDVRAELREFQPNQQQQGKTIAGAGAGGGEGVGAGEQRDFLGNYEQYLEQQKALRDRARQKGAGGILRKRNLLGGQQQQPTPQLQLPLQLPQQQQQQLQIMQLTQGAAAIHQQQQQRRSQYRKTVWERMTDPAEAEKQDKDLQEKEQAWLREAQAHQAIVARQ